MYKRLFWTFAIALLLSGNAWAQGTITGRVFDAVTEEALPGANVGILDTPYGAASGPDGRYTISGIPAGDYLVRASFVSYEEVNERVTLEDGQTLELDFAMQAEQLEIDELVVTALGFRESRDTRGTADAQVGGQDIVRSGENTVLRGLAAKAPGIDVTASGGDPGAATRIVIRGQSTIQGDNEPLIVIDGVPVSNATSTPVGDDVAGVQEGNRLNDLNPEDIESVEVLKSAAAAALWGSRAQGGVISITTKQGRAGRAGRPNVSYRSTVSFDRLNALQDVQTDYGQGFGGFYTFSTPYSWGDYLPNRSGEDFAISEAGRYFTVDEDGNPVSDLYQGVAVGQQTGREYYYIPEGGMSVLDTQTGEVIDFGPAGGRGQGAVYDPSDALFQTGTFFDNNISVSGGDVNGRYFLGLGHLAQDGIILENSSFDRTSIRLNAERFLSSKLSVQGTANYVRTASDRIQQGSNLAGLLLGGLRNAPDFDISDYAVDYFPSGLDGPSFAGLHRAYRAPLGAFNASNPTAPASPIYDNPLFVINRNANESLVNRIQGKVGASYDPTPWLNLTARTGADYYSDRRQIFFPVFNSLEPTGVAEEILYSGFQVNGDLIARATRDVTEDVSGSLLLGVNVSHREFDELSADLTTFSNPVDIRSLQNAELANITAFTGQNVRRTLGVYGELGLDLYEQLFLNFTGRFDNASTFGPDAEDTFFYPSATLAWQFSDLLGENAGPISFGKLRASYGEVGREPNPYLSAAYVVAGSVGDGYTGFETLDAAAYGGGFEQSNRLASRGIVPERTKEFEVGLDLRFLNDRYSLSGTYYNKQTEDAIFNVDVAPSTGFLVRTANAAELSNEGFEVQLDAAWPEVGDFAWNTYVNWYTNNNIVEDLAGVEEFGLAGFTSLTSSLVEGEPFGVLFGNRFRRADESICTRNEMGECENSSQVSYEPLTDAEIEDGFTVGDDGIVLDPFGFPTQALTQGIVGDPNPDWRAGIGNTLRYKDLSLNVLFDFKAGGDVWNGTKGALSFFGRAGNQNWRTTVSAEEATNPEIVNAIGLTLQGMIDEGLGGDIVINDDGSYTFRGYIEDFGGGPAIVDQSYYWSGTGSGFTGPSEQFIEDGSFVRLREVTLSYAWRTPFVQRLGFQSIDFSATGRNLWLATDYSGVDPETNLTGPSNGQGLDYFNNPSTRSYQFTVRFNY
jgi:TonB-linked SusC/RagA family outer membrane protein